MSDHPPGPTVTGPAPADPDATVAFDASPGAVPFDDLTPHARGGLGEVYRGTDPDLHRTVAVKFLQDRHAKNPDARRRFLVEAEVTARLEHPSIVPVYGLYPGGDRPAYAMRFVEGRTLAEAVAAYHAGPPDPVAFRRLLQAFLQVCQAVAYAHSRGVIHRDLKPQNVMLGRFGEALVVDWGLAKVVGRPEAVRLAGGVEETLIPASGDSDPSVTAMGSAVGTPAYMSPEQAAGRWDVIAPASDVYGLGAVLYTVLTGRPPLGGGNWPELQQKIQRGDIPHPRQVKAGVPRPLEAVCRTAMALDPAARYPSAVALAADIEHWLADEPVAAHREPATARARRWAKRNRTLVTAAGVLLAAAVAGLAAGVVLLERKNVEVDGQRRAAETARQKAEALNRFLTDDLLKQADPAVNPVGDKLTVRQLLDKASARLDGSADLAGLPEVESEVRAVLGRAYENLGVADRAEQHYRRAWELRAAALGPEDPATLTARNDYVYVVADHEQGAAVTQLARDAHAASARALGDGHRESARALGTLGYALATDDDRAGAEQALRRSSDLLRAAVGPDHRLTLEVDNNLAVLLGTTGRPAEAEPILRSIADRRRRNPRDPDLTLAIANQVGVLVVMANFAAAEEVGREAVAVGNRTVGPTAVGTLSARSMLGYAVEGQGRWAEAEREYREVLGHRRATHPPGSFDVQRSLAFLARLSAKQGRWREAAPYLAELMSAQRPDPARPPEALAAALVAALDGAADPAAAEPLLRECWEAVKKPLWQGDWLRAELGSRYGDALRRAGKFDDARPVLEAAADEVARSIGPPAGSAAAARNRVADLYDAWKKPAEAAKWRQPAK